MAKGKLILICHSGGEFVTSDDGTMSYNGGEASAVNITSETSFNDVKLMLAEACDLDQKTVSIKYFLPGNKKNLIVVKNDKDVKRMIEFHGDVITGEVFVMGTTGFDHSALDKESNRVSVTEKNETSYSDKACNKKDKAATHGSAGSKKDETVKCGKVSTKKDSEVPGRRTTRATAAAAAGEVSSDDNPEGSTDSAKSDGTPLSDSSDSDNEKENSDSGSDYAPKRSAYQIKRKGEIDADTSPADTVKKRRRTATWKFGANGRPTILSFPDNKPSKSRGSSGKAIAEKPGREKSKRKSSRLVVKGDGSTETKSGRKRPRGEADDSDQEHDFVTEKESDSEENLNLSVGDDYATTETMVDSWKSAITGAGQEFDSVNEFRAALKKYAIANRFGYRFKKNDTTRAIGGCAAEGCTWKFYAVWVPTTQSFMIKTLNNVHTCDKETRKSAHPAKNWLVGTIKDRLRESPYLKPKEIANGLLQDFGVELNYSQVWRGIGDAREQLHGSQKESYNRLPWFCEKIVETNPGSIANLVIDDKKRFKSLFVSFYTVICGFQSSCRPLIFLEAASMRSKYGEILLTANAIDGNDGFIPIAFAVVDVEDDDNWVWFLEQLKTSILISRPTTFVMDKDKNLKESVLAVFEDAHIGYSIYHLLTSFKRNMKGPFHGEGKAFLTLHFLAAAHAVRLAGFKKSTEQIKSISSQAYDWVMQIEPEHWASSHFKGERYNYITEDVGESHAKLMEDYRHLPILPKINALIRTMIDDMEDAKQDASTWFTHLTSLKERELEEEKVKARGLKVLISSDILFEVREDCTHVVNVGNWSCTCKGWKERGIPCRHALAVFSSTGKDPYDFCSQYFTAEAYCSTYAQPISQIRMDVPLLQHTLAMEKEEADKEGQKVEGEKEEVSKEDHEMEDGNKETGEELQKEEGSREGNEIEDAVEVEGEKMEIQKDKVIKEEIEEDEVVKQGNEKDGVVKEGNEKDDVINEGNEKDDVINEGNEEDEAIKQGSEEDEAIKQGSEKDEAIKQGSEKDEAINEGNEKDEAINKGNEKDEAINEGNEKDESINKGNEKDEAIKHGNEKDEAIKQGNEEDKVVNQGSEKDEALNKGNEKDEVIKQGNEKDEAIKEGNEKDEAINEGNERDEVIKQGNEKDEVIKEANEKTEVGNVDGDNEEGAQLDAEKEDGSKVDAEKEGGSKLDAEKDEGKAVRVKEEHEDPNVLVLPPITARSSSLAKKEMEGVETEGETKRKVTCTKCKQLGHYKKSCKTKL